MGKTRKKFDKVTDFLLQYPAIIAILVLMVVLTFASDVFLTVNNLMNVLRQVSMTAILAAGMCFVAFGGNVDISVGSTVGLVNIVWAKMMVDMGMNPLLSALICIAMCVLIGVINGVLVARYKFNAMIATFAMQSILRGCVYIVSDSYPVYNVPESVHWLNKGSIGVITVPIIIMVIFYVICWFVATYTKYGRRLYATGGNPEAAHLSGIKTERTVIWGYVVVQLSAALAAFILTARLNAGIPTSGTGWEFEAIIAAIIGGVSLNGGRGKVPGAFLGAVFVGLLVNGMTLLDIGSYYQQVIKGLILIGAIFIDSYSGNRKKKA